MNTISNIKVYCETEIAEQVSFIVHIETFWRTFIQTKIKCLIQNVSLVFLEIFDRGSVITYPKSLLDIQKPYPKTV